MADEICCPFCNVVFDKVSILDTHVVQIACFGRPSTCADDTPKRNRSRTASRHIGDFVLYLKDNLRYCAATTSVAVPLTPFATNKRSADCHAIGQAIVTAFRKEHRDPYARANLASVLTTCLNAAWYMTTSAVKLLGPIPGLPTVEEATTRSGRAGETSLIAAAKLKDRLENALTHAWKRDVSLFNKAPNIKRHSFINKTRIEATQQIKRFASAAVVLGQNVEEALGVCPDIKTATALGKTKFIMKLTAPGMPALGYYQHLGFAIWKTFEKRHFRMPVVHPGCTVQTGAAAGLLRIFPEAKAKAMISKKGATAYRAMYLRSLRLTLKREWKKHGRRVKYPIRIGIADELKAIAAQLCEWHRSGFDAEVHPKSAPDWGT